MNYPADIIIIMLVIGFLVWAADEVFKSIK